MILFQKRTKKIHKILVIRTDRIGDVILSTPVLTSLKNHYKDVKITMMVRNYTKDIIAGHPDVDEIILIDTPENAKVKNLLNKIYKKKYDIAILLHPRFKLSLLLFLARIPIRISTAYRWYSFLFNRKVFEHRKTAEYHELDYNLRMLRVLDIPFPDNVNFKFEVPTSEKLKITSLLKSYNILKNDKIIILHPGSGGSALDWPIKYYAQLSDCLSQLNNVKIIITGGKNEHYIIDELLKKTNLKPITIVGSLTLKQMAALIQRSQLFISNSTGPLHLAVALNTEVISFYCPIIPCLPTRWGPYNKIHDSVLMPDVPFKCRKCINENCKYYYCMAMISVERVFEMVLNKLMLVKIQ